MPLKSMHPTAQVLVATVDKLMDTKPVNEIVSELVLEKSGISKGSMYHHFEDFHELIETTMLVRYAKWIDLSIEAMAALLDSAKTKKELRAALFKITERTQRSDLKQIRIERARIFGEAERNPRLSKKLIAETERMTESLEDLVREVIERGLFKKNLDPRTVAVFIQGYSLGFIVNDFVEKRVEDATWVAFINSIIDQMFIGD